MSKFQNHEFGKTIVGDASGWMVFTVSVEEEVSGRMERITMYRVVNSAKPGTGRYHRTEQAAIDHYTCESILDITPPLG